MAKLFLYGMAGAGKTFVGKLLRKETGIYFHDADQDMPESMRRAISERLPITDTMRDEFADAIIEKVAALNASYTDFCIAQAVFKKIHRDRIQAAHSCLQFVLVDSSPQLLSARLRARVHSPEAYKYFEMLNLKFERPENPVARVLNGDSISDLKRALNALVKNKAGSSSSLSRVV